MNKRIAVLIFLFTSAWGFNLAWALCIGPSISLNVTTDSGAVVTIRPVVTTSGGTGTSTTPPLSPGAAVTLNGEFFTDGCHDVCINGRCPPTYPAKGIRLLFIQLDKTVELGKIDADLDFRFSRKANLPYDALSGPATIVAETLYEGHTIRTSPILFTVVKTR